MCFLSVCTLLGYTRLKRLLDMKGEENTATDVCCSIHLLFLLP